MFIVRYSSLFLLVLILTCNYSNGKSLDDSTREKGEKPDPSDDVPAEKQEDGTEASPPTEIMELPEEAKVEENEAPEKTKSEESSPEDEESDETIARKVEYRLTDEDMSRKPVGVLKIIFEKVAKEASGKTDEELETKNPFDREQKKEQLFLLLREYYATKDVFTISEENFSKLWRQKEKEYGKKFPFIVENVIVIVKDMKKINVVAGILEDELKDMTEKGKETSVAEESETTEMLKVVEDTTETASATEPSIPKEIQKEKPPKNTFAVSEKDKICVLAKFQSDIRIIYPSELGEQEITVSVPNATNAHSKGKCDSPMSGPLLKISWGEFIFTLIFDKVSDETWSVEALELSYDTSEKAFDGAINQGKYTARSKNVNLFETPMGRSYFCGGHETVLLYIGEKQVSTVKLSEMQLQPYEVKDGKFSEKHYCTQVILQGPDPFVVNETIPLAVGCTLALITLMILIGFSVYRAYKLKAKVDYNSME